MKKQGKMRRRGAVDECVSEGILAEFFREHREEIVEMGVYEFDQELHDKVLFEEKNIRDMLL